MRASIIRLWTISGLNQGGFCMNRWRGALLAALALTLVAISASVPEHGAIVATSQPANLTDTVTPHRRVPGYGNLPIRFEPNVGQAPPQTEYVARGDGYTVALTEQRAVLSLRQGTLPQDSANSTPHARTSPAAHRPVVLGLRLMHASAKRRLRAERQQNSVSNYFIGNDPAKWHRDVANYAAVRYQQIYPGIDWVVYGNPQQLEYDFVVAPQADPRRIEVKLEGANLASLADNGDLLVKVRRQIMRQLRPVIYQVAANGARHYIDGHYVLNHQHFAFALGDYDHSRQLIIDPVFIYSTYFGGSGGDWVQGVAADRRGNAYIAGHTGSMDFPTLDPFQSINKVNADQSARGGHWCIPPTLVAAAATK
jgi:hypothetical protein